MKDQDQPIIVSPAGMLALADVGTEDDLGCVGCGVREVLGQHKEPMLFEHQGGRYWHISCAEKALSKTERQHRPHDYADRPIEEQWAIDKRLGLLDKPPDEETTSDGEIDAADDDSMDHVPIRLTALGEQVARAVLSKVVLSVDDLASFLGMSTVYFLDLLKAGELPPVTLYVEDIEGFKEQWLAMRHSRVKWDPNEEGNVTK